MGSASRRPKKRQLRDPPDAMGKDAIFSEADEDVEGEEEDMTKDSVMEIEEESDDEEGEDEAEEDSAEGTEDYGDEEYKEDAVDKKSFEELQDMGIMDQSGRGSWAGEMDELEKEYQSIREEQQSILKNLKRRKDEDFRKGHAIKKQKVLWNKCLQLRLNLQKVFSNSNKLPQEPTRSLFCDQDESTKDAYSSLISSSKHTLKCILGLQKVLIQKNPSIDVTNEDMSNDNDIHDDKEWRRIYQIQHRIAMFRNSAVDKWHRKTQVATGAASIKGKLHAFNQTISEQVASYMRDPSRMIRRMQLRRSTSGILGEVIENSTRQAEEEEAEGDPELVEDSEFYQQLLKEILESFDAGSHEAAFYDAKRTQTKKRKLVDRRASKSRKIRYNVHDKIVNFMAPKPMNLPEMAPILFENLFGLRGSKQAAV